MFREGPASEGEVALDRGKAYAACLATFGSSENIDETVGGSRGVRSGEVSGECMLCGRILENIEDNLRAPGLVGLGLRIPAECLDISSSASRS